MIEILSSTICDATLVEGFNLTEPIEGQLGIYELKFYPKIVFFILLSTVPKKMPNIESTLLGTSTANRKEIILPPLRFVLGENYVESRAKPTTIKIRLRRDQLVASSTYERDFASFEGDFNDSAIEEYSSTSTTLGL